MDLAACIGEAVESRGFRRFTPAVDGLPWIAAWKRKTWNTNRGIALLTAPADIASALDYARSVKGPAGKAIGYLPVLYELGLQMVLVGPGLMAKAAGLKGALAKINSFTVILQSLHAVDPEAGVALSTRTWGQFVSGPWIDAIESGIAAYLGGAPPASGRPCGGA